MTDRLRWLRFAAPAGMILTLATAAAWAQPPARPVASAAQVPTPRTADGKPDLNGFWGAGPAAGEGEGAPGPFARGALSANAEGEFISPMNLRNGDISNLTNDGVIGRRSTNNLPLYKPQFWEKVEDLDYHGNQQDPFNSCMPPSVPRMGAPRRIVQTPTEIFLFYAIQFQRNDFRIVPIGARTRQPDRDGSWMGDPVARWDGDTLVIESIGFNPGSWFGPQGYLHGYEMKVTETLRRDGDRLIYNSTVDDPEYLQKPWQRDQVVLNRIATPGYRLEETPPCSDRDLEHQVGKQREM